MRFLKGQTTDACRRLQHTLAELGPVALRDDEAAQRHLEECDECFSMLEALTALDAGFEAMPQLDASDALVESLLERVSLQQDEELRDEAATRPARRSWAAVQRGFRILFTPGRPGIRPAIAFGMLAVLSVSVFLNSQFWRAAEPFGERELRRTLPAVDPPAGQVRRAATKAGEGWDFTTAPEIFEQERKKLQALGYLGSSSEQLGTGKELEQAPAGQRTAPEIKVKAERNDPRTADTAPIGAFEAAHGERVVLAPRAPELVLEGAKDDQVLGDDRVAGDLPSPARSAPAEVRDHTEANITFRGGSPRVESDVSGPFDADRDQRARVRERLRGRLASLPRGLQDAEQSGAEGKWNKPDGDGEETPDDAKGGKGSSSEPAEQIEELLTVTAESPAVESAQDPAPRSLASEETPAGDSARELARRFLAERDAVTATSRPATGYWTNTYVPGDPVLRYLQARLAGRDRLLLAMGKGTAAGAEPPRPHDGARRTTQPFDPPADAALAVQLQSDRTAVLGETRMLVQVGLAGTPRGGGRRPAMNVAVVLDLRGEIPVETGASLVGLAGAFGEARDLGDRFRLLAAGRGDGELLAPESFQRGPAVVATRNLLAGAVPAGNTALSLVEAVRLAIDLVALGDDPAAPLGSSAIVVATPWSIGATTETLAEMAHKSAVAGIPLSVVGVGDAVTLAELDALALAGQGSRRLLRDASGARGLVDRELAAAGRAVARAVRLRISLAPGVRLIDVVGARRHGEAGAEQVREAERALDRRLARNLGVEADRGDDEAGIQIVIPTFYAGDHHVVLLDVVASGPGPIADVTVRFKDLVQLENAVVRTRLDVARGEAGRGPLERNVLKNLLAYRLRDVLDGAGHDVARDDRKAAAKRLEEHRRLLAGLRLELAGAGGDPDLGLDVAMLDEYVHLLGGQWLETPERRQYLVDSLLYAARLKVLPAPVPVGGAM